MSGKEGKRERETSSEESTPPWSLHSGSSTSQFHSRSPSQSVSSTITPGLINQAVSIVVDSAAASQKIPIPRGSAKVSDFHHRNRATRACDPCRLHKVKCEGENPPCKRCLGLGLLCVYADVKRVRQMKQIEYLEQKVDRYERLLQEIIVLVDDHTARRIQRALEDCDAVDVHEGDHDGVREPHLSEKKLPSRKTIRVQDLIHREQELIDANDHRNFYRPD